MIKGSELQNREGVGESAMKEDPQEKLRILLERLARARRTNTGEDRHCADCFRRGRDAVFQILDEP
jgi:hypothetical protein